MSAQLLAIEGVEFSVIKVETNSEAEFELHKAFPRVSFNFDDTVVLTRARLYYSPDNLEDPKSFLLSYGVKITQEDQKKDSAIPYDIEVEAAVFLTYNGGESHVGVDRFRAVRFSGYQILHGAIREMVSGLTARCRHGMLMLPAQNFQAVAKRDAEEDELRWKARLEKKQALLTGETATPPKAIAKKKATKNIKA